MSDPACRRDHRSPPSPLGSRAALLSLAQRPDAAEPGRRLQHAAAQLSARRLPRRHRRQNVVKSVHLEAGHDKQPPGDRDPLAAGDRRRPALARASRTASSPMPISATRGVEARAGRPLRLRQHARHPPDPQPPPRPDLQLRRSRLSRGAGLVRQFRPAEEVPPVVRPAALFPADGGGGRARAALSRHPDHHQPHRHAGRPRRREHPGLAARHGAARRVPERRDQDLRPRHGRPSLDGREHPALRARGDRPVRGRALHVRQQLPGRQDVQRLRRPVERLPHHHRGFTPAERAALFHDNAARFYRL